MEYSVREAVLVKRGRGSAWRVTFAPTNTGGDDIVVEISRDRLEDMSFATVYTAEEIEALRTAG